MGNCGSSGKTFEEKPVQMTATPAANARDAENARDAFVERKGSELYLAGAPLRFHSFNAPHLTDGQATDSREEISDTMQTFGLPGAFGSAVTRTYTLRINSKNIGNGHIKGWNAEWNDWEWDGHALEGLDAVLDEAYRWGVKIIIPLINQDFGGEDTNWVGNFTDLIRYRHGMSYAEAKNVDWWTDHTMIESFKLIIDKLTSRVNSINGRKYSEDPTILAWETGNEMNRWGHQPAPASWTLTVARHLKARAPRHLVMDGSFARNDSPERCYCSEVLDSPDVDILSYHYYGSGEISRARKDCQIAVKKGKVFVAGEYGFFEKPDDYAKFTKAITEAGGAGTLVWSMRPHSRKGGFLCHGEGNGVWSYHVPGFSHATHSEWDTRETQLVQTIRDASFKIAGLKTPKAWPVPATAPRLFWLQQGYFSFVGSAWAFTYKIIYRDANGNATATDVVSDCTKEGEFGIAVKYSAHAITVIPVSVDHVDGPESAPLFMQ